MERNEGRVEEERNRARKEEMKKLFKLTRLRRELFLLIPFSAIFQLKIVSNFYVFCKFLCLF